MSETSTLDLPSDGVENVVVFVGDAVRWDYSCDALAERGRTVKTVAASSHTPTSFASMLTGWHPVEHGVHGFHRPVPDAITSLFDVPDHNTYFGEGYMNDWLADRQRLFGDVSRASLRDAEAPFVWVNRDGGGHAPYGGFDDEGQGYRAESARVYLDRHAGNTDRFRDDYARGVEEFVDRVDGVLDTLDERGLRSETLVVVASDHGELLGEYGQIGHNFPFSPELVYVPTCFVVPGGDTGIASGGVMGHVDLVPTLESVLGVDVGRTGGVSATGHLPEYQISHYNRAFSDVVELGLQGLKWGEYVPMNRFPELRLELLGCWDSDGGYVVNRAPRHATAAVLLLRLLMTPEGKHIRATGSYREALRHIAPSFDPYGNPSMDEETARSRVSEYLDAESVVEESESLDPAARQQLKDLGYV